VNNSRGTKKNNRSRNIYSEESQNSQTAKTEVSYSGTANIKGIGNVSELGLLLIHINQTPLFKVKDMVL
jgi:hypothetical protein